MKNQPCVEEKLFQKVPNESHLLCASSTPQDLRVDPIFCPWRRRLNAPDEHKEPSESYMVRIGQKAIN